MVLPRKSTSQLDDIVACEFDDTPAPAADHVIVRIFTETKFVMGLFHIKSHLLENTAIDQKRQRSVNGSLRCPLSALTHCEQQLLRFEVVGDVENGVEDVLPRQRILDASVFEIALEHGTRLVRIDMRFDFDHGHSR